MVKIRLGNYAKVDSGFAFKSKFFNDGNGIPVIRIRDVNAGKSNTFYSGEFSNRYIVNKGDLLITMDGDFKIKEWDGEKALLNQRVCRIKSISKELNEKYLLYILPNVLKNIENKTPFVTVKHLSTKDILDSQIRVPNIDIQDRIVNILNLSSDLIKKRKAQISALSSLTQSVFYEMFGDPVINNHKWSTKVLPKLVQDVKHDIKRGPFGGALKKEIFINEGYLVYEQYHAINEDFSMKRYFITEEKYRKMEAFAVKTGDLIISCSGTLGKIAEIPENSPQGIINQALLKLALDEDIMNHTFFINLFRNEHMQKKIFGISRGSGIANFPSMSVIKSIEFICPPISLQKQFECKVKKINQLKLAFKKSLQLLENNFHSLMQQVFKGELFKD